MPSVTVNYTFNSDAQGWLVHTATGSWDSADGNPAGSLAIHAGSGSFRLSQTWQAFGVPAGTTVTGVDLTLDAAQIGGAMGDAGFQGAYLLDSSGTQQGTFNTGSSLGIGSWNTFPGATVIPPSGMQAASTSIILSVNGSSNGSASANFDNIVVTITYSGGGIIYVDTEFYAVGIAYANYIGASTASATGTAIGEANTETWTTYSATGSAVGEAIATFLCIEEEAAYFGVFSEAFADGVGEADFGSVGTAVGSSEVIGVVFPGMVFSIVGESIATGQGSASSDTTFTVFGEAIVVGEADPQPSYMIAVGETLADGIGASVAGSSFSVVTEAITTASGTFGGTYSVPAGSSYGLAVGAVTSTVYYEMMADTTGTAIGSAATTTSTSYTVASNPKRRGSPCGCSCTSPPPPPPASCPVTVSVTGCSINTIQRFPYPGGSGCETFNYPTTQNNLNIGAQVTITGPSGLNLTVATSPGQSQGNPGNIAVFNGIGSSYNGVTLTVSVTANGYNNYSTTFVYKCPTTSSTDNFVYATLCPTQKNYIIEVYRCDDSQDNCDILDRSGSQVSISGFGSGSSSKDGVVYIDGVAPDCGNTIKAVMTVSNPSPYYATTTGTITLGPGCTNGTGGYLYFSPPTVSTEPNVCLLPLAAGYKCYQSAYKGGCTGVDNNARAVCAQGWKHRPYPLTLNGTINGVNCSMTDNGSGVFEGTCTIQGVCCRVYLPAGTMTFDLPSGVTTGGGFGVYVYTEVLVTGNPPVPVQPLQPPYCKHILPGGAAQTYPSNCGCNPGDSEVTAGTAWICTFIPMLDTFGPGWKPLNAQSQGVSYSFGQTNSFITPDATVTE